MPAPNVSYGGFGPQSTDHNDSELPADESLSGTSRRRSRPEINRRVPHQSFAYGAPSDGKANHRRSISSSGRRSVGADAVSPGLESGPSSPAKLGSDEMPRVDDSAPQMTHHSAATRYAALKARRQQGASTGAKLNLGAASSPGPRRSTRLSVASESQDADNASRTKTIADIEEDQPEESSDNDEEVNELGQARKSSVPPPSGPTFEESASRNYGAGRSDFMASGAPPLNSFFVRAPALSLSPGPSEERSRLMMPSSLLRGTQRPSHDPLSPRKDKNFDRRRDVESIRSSEAGDSRSYASEEAFVRRTVADRDSTPPARPLQTARSELGKLSPWHRNGISNAAGPTADEVANDDAEEDRAASARRKPRISNDKTYRPPKNFEDDSSDLGSEGGGRKQTRRRKSDVAKSSSVRSGRDDDKIWTNKKRKGRRAHGQEVTDVDATLGAESFSNSEEAQETSSLQRASPVVRKGSESVSRPFSDAFTLKAFGFIVLVAALIAVLMPRQGTIQSSVNLPFHGSLSGFRSLFSKSATYREPETLPADFEGFAVRLLSLETTVGALSSSSVSLATTQEQLSRQFQLLEMGSKEVRAMLHKMEQDGGVAEQKADFRIKALDEVGKQIKGQVERLEKKLAVRTEELAASMNAAQAQKGEDAKRMAARLEKLRADLQKTEEELKSVAASARDANSVAQQAKRALQPLLEANLPAQMPVRIDKRTGKPSIEPWFYESLKTVMAGMPAAAANEGHAGNAISAQGSWDSFRRAHETTLRALIADETANVLDMRRRSKDEHALLSRSDFLEVLKNEMESLKVLLEQTFNANAQEMQNDILGKVRAQQAMYEEAGSSSKNGKVATDTSADSYWGSLPDLSSLRSTDGKDPRNSILALVEAALEAYSADKINRADFALYSAGGRVIPSMTSPTLDLVAGPRAGGKGAGLLRWLSGSDTSGGGRGRQHLRSRSPVVALHHDNAPGMCWPFAGQTGQLGIQLARRALVTDITIEHPPSTLTFGDSSSAPKEVTVSALVEHPEDRQRLTEWRRRQAAEKARRLETEDEGEGAIEIVDAPPSANHLHLATFTYDALVRGGGSRRSIQTFPVSAEARALAIPVSILQVRILSNHGEKAYTCLYRVRVHGEAWKDAE